MPTPTVILSLDPARREALARALTQAGRDVLPVAEPEAAAEALSSAAPEALLVDLAHPALDRTALQRGLAPARPADPEPLAQVERRHIADVLAYTGGNRRRAAQLLGISRSTLHNKIRRYDLGER